MLLHKFSNDFALKGLNKCLSVDRSYFGFPNMYLKPNVSQPISTKLISTDTIRFKPIRSKPIRGPAYRPMGSSPLVILLWPRLF